VTERLEKIVATERSANGILYLIGRLSILERMKLFAALEAQGVLRRPKRGGGKTADKDRRWLLTVADIIHEEGSATWPKIFPLVKEIADEWDLDSGGWDNVANLQSAVTRLRKTPGFAKYRERVREEVSRVK
jgi:hypothetical protein